MRRKMKPVVPKTADGLLFPVRTEVVTLQELDKSEGKQHKSEVQAFG